MILIENQFFALLRAGLWNKEPDMSLFEGDVAWGELLDMAKKQTVLGVLGDGIGKLPEEYRPSPADLHRLKSQLHLIRRSHLLLNATLKEVCARLREADIHPILLKGQGVALCYRYPEQRQCGDIDLYIPSGDYEKACSVVRDFGQKTGEESESIQHYHFTRNGVTIEIHRLAAYSVDKLVSAGERQRLSALGRGGSLASSGEFRCLLPVLPFCQALHTSGYRIAADLRLGALPACPSV